MGQNVKKNVYFGGPEGVFNDQTKPILLSSYPLTHIYVHVKIRKQSDKTFLSVIKCSPHHNGDICTTRGNNLKTSFSYMVQNVKKKTYFGLFRGPWGGLQWSDWAYLSFQLSSHPYPCTCRIRKQSDKNFLSLNPKYEKIFIFFIFGGSWGGPYVEPRWMKISGH